MGVADWERIQELFDEALGLDAGARDAFLVAACGGDHALLEEVRSLLAAHAQAGSFIQPPAAAIPTGTRFGSHEVVARLGAGGMGEVYRAHDAKLGRDVAIKILPRQFAADPDRRARLEREARLLATLNHPHIGGIYGLEDREGSLALLLELVEGETLAERIGRGRPDKPSLKVREALSIARQIADALEAAHDKGIVHRDLKPANIKVTPTGTVKVLDFGIAKASAADASGGEPGVGSASGAAGTGLGAVIGTPAYMSPEQARGTAIDKRTDIWAFGCVVYEMLTGHGVFGGDTPSETMAAVFDRTPDWHALPEATPSNIRRLLQRCLDPDPSRRLHDIADARLEIDDALAAPAAETLAVRPVPSRRFIPLAMAALAGGAVIALLAWPYTRPSPRAPEPPSRFTITLASDPLNLFGSSRALALSPDGRQLVYRAGGSLFGSLLMLRAIDELAARPLAGIKSASGPFFSPDSQWIGFFEGGQGAPAELKKVSISGGPAITVCRVAGMPLGASWGDDATIVFATDEPGTGLWQVSASGGEPAALTKPDTARGETDHAFPSVITGGRGVLFTILTAGPDKTQVAILDRKTGRHQTLVRGGSQAEYVEPGHLIYAAGGMLRSVGFDPVRLEVLGDPVPVAETVLTTTAGAAHYAVSRSGTIVYAPRGSGAQQSPVWVDRRGREEPINTLARSYTLPRLSPDGTRIALTTWDPDADLWIWDLVRERATRLTFDPANDVSPVWTPDSRRIIFASLRGGARAYDLYSAPADGTGTAERLTTSTHGYGHLPSSITPDGTRVLGYEQTPEGDADIFMTPARPPANTEVLLHTRFNEVFPEASPNGRYLAYQSNESGEADVYVRPFPDVERGVWKVSKEGGFRFGWAHNGRELFYIDGSKTLMSVPVDTSGATFRAGTPVKLFDASKYSSWAPPRNFDVSPDGRRFLMIKDGPVRDQLVVVQRWFEELKASASGGR
ncbi:MAG TPA: protein kinase [Vicinamibacteria bacterium]|jgi:serine/threonine-protein kinase